MTARPRVGTAAVLAVAFSPDGSRPVTAGADRLTRFAKGGGGFASAPDRRLVFGLGSTKEVGTITVHWPGGGTQDFQGLAPDRYWRLVQGAPEAVERR